MVNHNAVATDRFATNRLDQRIQLTHTLWRWLSSRTTLGVLGVIVFLLLLCALFIRQMPGTIADDPAAATRWLLTVSEEYGPLGGILRTLGLFDVLHNPLLQLLLAAITLVLLIHLANLLATLRRFQQVEQRLTTAGGAIGAPAPLPDTQPLYRWRQTINRAPETLAAQLPSALKPYFDELLPATVAITSVPPLQTSDAAPMADAADEAASPPPTVVERRLLARRHQQRWIWLRPLLLVGLLLALIDIWLILVVGWEVTSPLLAPGDQYRATTQRVALTYAVVENDETLTPSLTVEMNDATNQVPLGESRRLAAGQVTLQAAPGPPALWLRSNDATVTLSQPGQSQNTVELGLIFPTLGREESVVVGGQVGLRIVRVAVLPVGLKVDETGAASADTLSQTNNSMVSPIDTLPQEQFLLEVIQSEAEPVQTLVINRPVVAKIQVGGKVRELTIVPVASMTAMVRYQPAIWLLWLALALVLVGLVGFAYQPAFLLIQLAPWPMGRSVVVAQSDAAAEIDRLRRSLPEDFA
ncbi:MAG: hypothetical protein DYG89_39625 [Caldilinea sp. CFX5]|nr:hypothetical protein [Caldilinea sp. CFX5]